MSKTIEVYFDGGTVGPNGALGTVQKIMIGVWIPKLDLTFSRCELGISNNVAELRALTKALAILYDRDLQGQDIKVFGDSLYALNCARHKRYAKKKPHLFVEQQILYPLIERFSNIIFSWIPREENCIADALTAVV